MLEFIVAASILSTLLFGTFFAKRSTFQKPPAKPEPPREPYEPPPMRPWAEVRDAILSRDEEAAS